MQVGLHGIAAGAHCAYLLAGDDPLVERDQRRILQVGVEAVERFAGADRHPLEQIGGKLLVRGFDNDHIPEGVCIGERRGHPPRQDGLDADAEDGGARPVAVVGEIDALVTLIVTGRRWAVRV